MRKMVLFILLIFTSTIAAQEETCPVVIQTALTTAAESCAEIGPYHACYGSDTIQAEMRADSLESPGDTVPLSSINTLTFGEHYGIVLMTPRANLIDSHLTMVAFGNISLTNESSAGASFVAVEVTAKRQGAFIRILPDASSDLMQPLNWGESVTAIGQLEGGAWLHVLLPEGTGWVETTQVESDTDFEVLQAYAEPLEVGLSPYGAMQAFSLSTQEGSPCAADSGVIIQTPDLETEGLIVVNHLPLRFNGTIFVSPQPKRLYVSALEGQATLDEAFTVDAGEMMYARLDDDGKYLDVSKVLEPYYFARVRNTPYILLPRFIELPFSSGGLVEPFTPGTGFLTSMKLEDPCTVAWTEAVNLRSGPGTDYPVLDSIDPNFAARPNARAVGNDHQVWWRLAEGVWLFAGTTVFGGNCATLPVVEAAP